MWTEEYFHLTHVIMSYQFVEEVMIIWHLIVWPLFLIVTTHITIWNLLRICINKLTIQHRDLLSITLKSTLSKKKTSNPYLESCVCANFCCTDWSNVIALVLNINTK